MWDFSSEVKWWEEWQLRILVLGSLFMQFVLFIGSMARHARALKSIMWFAYLGSDALAIYGLTTLFNRHTQPAGSGAVQLEVLWAPVLVRHLGGLHSFTAYSVEDNDLWGRHLVTLVSQVTVALYVFCRSWPGGDKRLLVAATLLFIVGILKLIQKIWSLKAASFRSLLASSAVYPLRRAERSIGFINPGQLSESIADAVSLRKEEEHDLPLEDYVHKARELALKTEVDPTFVAGTPIHRADKSFVDMSVPYSRRLRILSSFLKMDLKGVHHFLCQQLAGSFVLIYTNIKLVIFSIPGFLSMLLLPFMSLASAVLFDQSHKDGYKEDDVRVTYILFWGTTVLELFPFFSCICVYGRSIWSITAAQHNIMSFSTRKTKPTKLMRVAGVMCIQDYINKHWYIQEEYSPKDVDMKSLHVCHEVLNLVVGHLKDGWKQFIVDAASYIRFNNLRGQWTIRKHEVRDPRLLWSLQVSFDQSVLIWHVATELCLHHPRTSSSPTSRQHRCSEVISNYMIYLLLIRPEMLMPGSRQGLFTTMSDDIEIMLEYADGPQSLDKRSVARRILHAAKSPQPYADRIGTWILKACKLAEDLMELLDDEEKRWEVIQGVWVEMLCYSAGRCRGYLHAKIMGEGVEFLSFVWLILSSMGMETLADKFQRPDPTLEEVYAGVTASQPQGVPV